MPYRTRVYIAADWDKDKSVVDKLREWNDSDYYVIDFTDAHDLTQANDSSLPCSIKSSLRERLGRSKTFVLIVGDHTDSVTKGSCQHCRSYNSYSRNCSRGHWVDYRSYIDFECDYASDHDLKVVVIYNSTYIRKNKCPEILRNTGKHIPAYSYSNGVKKWNYSEIKNAIMD